MCPSPTTSTRFRFISVLWYRELIAASLGAEDGLGDPRRRSAAAKIRRDVLPRLEHVGHCGLNRSRGRRLAEELQHHRAGEHRRHRVGDALGQRCRARIRAPARTSTGRPRGIEIRAGCQPEATRDRGAQIGQDVAEEVRGDDDIEVLRASHQIHARGIDQERLGPDIWRVARDVEKTRSQNAMLNPCAFDLVTDVSSFLRLRWRASSKAKRITRSVPWRVKIADCTATSWGTPGVQRPPTCAYSPSVFSRTTTKSISPAPSDEGTAHARVEHRRAHARVVDRTRAESAAAARSG